MAEARDILLEVGTEELPAASLWEMAQALGEEMSRRLDNAGLEHGDAKVFATPRRLAVHIAKVPLAQSDREVERRGPALSAAFDSDGHPTKAALGFARSCGVDLSHLEQSQTDKGCYLVFRSTEVGEATPSLLGRIAEESLAALPMRRRMRWSDLDVEFIRPVQWVVLLFGEDVVDATILGCDTTRVSRGHRFHRSEGISIERPDTYAHQLYSEGHVVADFDRRRDIIAEQLDERARAMGALIDTDTALLDEVTALVEWPVAVVGSFDERFLKLPTSVLVSTMKSHQRYFPVYDHDGSLRANFVTISNIESLEPDTVREGNERVLRPRFADAEFFVSSDRRRTPEQFNAALVDVVFQEQLGSMADKAARNARLAGIVAIAMGENQDHVKLARRAGALSKFDLMTQMVGEFPDLQGQIGADYASHAGEPKEVCDALAQAYWPRFAGDAIPDTRIGRALAIADKLDTLVGIFGIGQRPSGEKDPFALRRAALGVLRIMIEGELPLNLQKLIDSAAQGYDQKLTEPDVVESSYEFIQDRLRAYFSEQGVPAEVVAAVQARNPVRPFDFARRTRAVHEFYALPEAQSLAAANKRIQNILRQAEATAQSKINEELFRNDAEWDLAAKLIGITPLVQAKLKDGDYHGALSALATLRDSVDAFFEEVKVMDDDLAIKANRVAILRSISELFMETADISRLQA